MIRAVTSDLVSYPDRAVTASESRGDGTYDANPERRVDGWVNVTTGLGTSRDKTSGGFFQAGRFLTDQNIADLYNFDDLAQRIVDGYPREEFRLGFGYKGITPKNTTELERYLRKFKIVQHCTRARGQGRAFGGSVTWTLVDDGLDTSEPLDLARIRSVLGLRVIDRRWVIPETYYTDGAQVGEPETYRIQEPHPGGVVTTIGIIHESRLIRWPGAETDVLERNRRRGWDLSVLVRPYEALRQAGETWKAIELLVVDGNQGIYKVSNLYSKIANDPGSGAATPGDPTGGSAFLKRVQILDKLKSVFRAIVLDKDEEEYERQVSGVTPGLAELSDRAWVRVAAAGHYPVMILTGQAPSGLGASGNTTIQWYYNEAEANRTQIDEPNLICILRVLLSAQDAPEIDTDATDAEAEAGTDVLDKLGIVWLPLWAPTATELADIRLKRMQEATGYVTAQVLLPEEALLSLPEDWYPGVDRDLRKQSLEADAEALLAQKNAAALAQGEASIAGAKAAKGLAENPPKPGEDSEADPKAPPGKATPPASGKKPPPFSKG